MCSNLEISGRLFTLRITLAPRRNRDIKHRNTATESTFVQGMSESGEVLKAVVKPPEVPLNTPVIAPGTDINHQKEEKRRDYTHLGEQGSTRTNSNDRKRPIYRGRTSGL